MGKGEKRRMEGRGERDEKGEEGQKGKGRE